MFTVRNLSRAAIGKSSNCERCSKSACASASPRASERASPVLPSAPITHRSR